MLPTKLFRWLLSAAGRHQTALNAMMDPMVAASTETSGENPRQLSSLTPHYIFVALYISAGFIYGTFGLHYAVEGGFGPDFFASSRYTMVHQFVPRPS